MLWFIAIPLLDCIGLIVDRLKKGKNWSTAGRDHIHHKLMEKFSSRGTLFVILIITLITGLFGMLIDEIWPSYISMILFLIYGLVYYVVLGFFGKNFLKINKENV